MNPWAAPAPLSVGDPVPAFTTASRLNPNYSFTAVAGRPILLAFMPGDPAARAAALATFARSQALFADARFAAFFVTRETAAESATTDNLPGQRWFFDPAGELSRLFGALDDEGRERPYWLLLDRTQRVLARSAIDDPAPVFDVIAAIGEGRLIPDPPPLAPALVVPRVFEPELCRRLIAYYEAQGGSASGVMREIDGRTVGVLDPMKSRRDALIEDTGLRDEIRHRLATRLRPEVFRAFNFDATRVERYIVACYDAKEGGYFKPHRDNTTKGTAHRRFAVSINLNAEEFEGGDLRFPEFGSRTYRPPTGGAVVFCCAMLHEATPVKRGVRYAFLPFLYDAEGARIREENLAFLDNGPPKTATGPGQTPA